MTAIRRSRTLRRLIGQLMIVGVEGAGLTAVERAWLKLLQPGGIILFRRNIESAEQTYHLLAQATAAGAPFRCIDVEGGTVNRLRDLVAPIPSAEAVGSTAHKPLFRQHGRLIGRAVRMLGFNTTFAPVLDLGLAASRTVMQTRTVSSNPEVVARYGEAFLNGLAKEGIHGAGKHFPGLGGGTLDSHHSLPIIDRAWRQIWKQDLLPYRELIRKLPFIMVSHAAYPAITGDELPASISPFWLTGVLLRKLRYRGLILSDDMEMGGILTQATIEEAVIRAIEHGTDIVGICHSPDLIFRAYEALLSEAERSLAFERRVQMAARKIASVAKKLPTAPARPPAGRQIEALREELQEFSEAVEKAGRG